MIRVPTDFLSGRHQRGNAMPIIAGAVVIVLLLGLAAWFLILKPQQTEKAAPVLTQATVAETDEVTAAPPEDVGAMSVDELLEQAKNAMNDRRIVAPRGNNAFDFYLRVLEKEPENPVAEDALRETFPFAASAVEQYINADNFEEAQRGIDLLARADSGNYTLTILRSKLDAQRKLSARAEEQEKRAEEERQRALAAGAASTPTPPAQAEPEPAPAPVVEQPAPAPAVAQQPAPLPPAPEPEPVGPTRGAVLVSSVPPEYPAAALRARQQGWVELQFTVDLDGSVQDVEVLNAERGRVFNRAAINAVKRWRFQPALENGDPVRTTVTQTIEFKPTS